MHDYLCRWHLLSGACVIRQVLILEGQTKVVESHKTEDFFFVVFVFAFVFYLTLTGTALAVPAKHRQKMASFIFVLQT